MSEESEIRKIIEDKLTGINARLRSEEDISNYRHNELMCKLNEMKQKQDETNGQVQKVKKETRVVRYLERKPLLFLGIIFGVAFVANAVDFEEIINILSRII